jgi:bifunctional UDP-N-acetylglucosamine pyrophosphorylase/glucosamine-1-phosphate N-acetyltransferase
MAVATGRQRGPSKVGSEQKEQVVAAKRCVMVLAAGQGTRMKSAVPKVLHRIAGVPMVFYSVENALAAGADEVVVVVGHGREQVSEALAARFGDRVLLAVQEQQRGTADAVRAGLARVGPDVGEVVITYGDTPCVPAELLAALVRAREDTGARLALVTTEIDDPTGYGRILRDAASRVVAIREHKDCSPEERAIRWVNPGIYAVERAFLVESLGAIGSANQQGEFYLTDLVEIAARAGTVAEVKHRDAAALRGVNDRAELAEMEAMMWKALADRHRRNGATIAAGACVDRDVEIGADAWIGPGVCLRGRTRVGAGARIDVGCVVEDSAIGPGAVLKPYSVVTRSEVGAAAQIGPFAHLRPQSTVEDDAHVGNFVELKNTRMRRGAKANHLAYLGDGDVGAKANIGAGTIFCNYDGFQKYKTTVGEGAFVGSNSSLVAPVTVGDGAYVGSGSVVTADVPPGALAIGRARQVNKEGYADRLRELKKRG